MATIIKLAAPGGVDMLEPTEITLDGPGRGEIALRQTAIGVNFVDIYHRTGVYPLTGTPPVPGVEAAGIVEAIGEGVTNLRVGDRVVYGGLTGAYASHRLIQAARAIALPASVSDAVAAAAFVKAMTVHMLLTRVYPIGAGTTVLAHSAAGGVGSLLTRWAKQLGAVVIGTVGSPAKAEIARANGADHVIIGRDADFAAETARLTDGRGVDVAYDGVGGTTLAATFACLRPFGTVVSIGQAGGPIPPLHVEELGRRALSLSRPSVMAYMSEPETYATAARDVLAVLQDGLAPSAGRRYRLIEAALAHTDLEAGRTTGAVLLMPD